VDLPSSSQHQLLSRLRETGASDFGDTAQILFFRVLLSMSAHLVCVVCLSFFLEVWVWVQSRVRQRSFSHRNHINNASAAGKYLAVDIIC
jgi:hypothetical protein